MKRKKMFGLVIFFIISIFTSAYESSVVNIPSRAMGKSYKATVITPDGYKDSGKPYPVVYLLHGWSGNYEDWVKSAGIEYLADKYDVIIITPDGDYDKWYVDSKIKKDSKFSTYFGKEIIEYMDKNYRTIAEKEGRAITGLSMGGYGALYLTIKHPDTFGSVASMSGGVDPESFKNNWGISNVINPAKSGETWNDYVIASLAPELLNQNVNILIDCGVNDFFIESNRKLHTRLLNLNIPHDYTERPGGHTWDYWKNSIDYQVLFFSKHFSRQAK